MKTNESLAKVWLGTFFSVLIIRIVQECVGPMGSTIGILMYFINGPIVP